jgi:hypothetical protein
MWIRRRNVAEVNFAEGIPLTKEFMRFKQMMTNAGMDEFFDFDLASNGWQEDLLDKRRSSQTSEHGHPLTRFRRRRSVL